MDEYVSYLNKLNLANVIHSNKNARCSWFPEHAVQLSQGEPGDKSVSTQTKLPCTSVGATPNREKCLIVESDSPQTRERTLTWIMEGSLGSQQPGCTQGASGVVKRENSSTDRSCCLACLVCKRGASAATLRTVQEKFDSWLLVGKPNEFLSGTLPVSSRRHTRSPSQSVGLLVCIHPWTRFAGSELLLSAVLKCCPCYQGLSQGLSGVNPLVGPSDK